MPDMKEETMSRTVRLTCALSLAVAATAATGGSAAADGLCEDIGSGDLCMTVDDLGPGERRVSMWYRKHFGDPVTIRFFYQGRSSPDEITSSWRAVDPGEVTSWQVLEGPDCFSGGMDVQGGPTFYVGGHAIC